MVSDRLAGLGGLLRSALMSSAELSHCKASCKFMPIVPQELFLSVLHAIWVIIYCFVMASAAAVTTVDSWPCLSGGWMTEDEKVLADKLLSLDQSHIFSQWKVDGEEEQKHAFFEQVRDSM